jgi:hypothetical protein
MTGRVDLVRVFVLSSLGPSCSRVRVNCIQGAMQCSVQEVSPNVQSQKATDRNGSIHGSYTRLLPGFRYMLNC